MNEEILPTIIARTIDGASDPAAVTLAMAGYGLKEGRSELISNTARAAIKRGRHAREQDPELDNFKPHRMLYLDNGCAHGLLAWLVANPAERDIQAHLMLSEGDWTPENISRQFLFVAHPGMVDGNMQKPVAPWAHMHALLTGDNKSEDYPRRLAQAWGDLDRDAAHRGNTIPVNCVAAASIGCLVQRDQPAATHRWIRALIGPHMDRNLTDSLGSGTALYLACTIDSSGVTPPSARLRRGMRALGKEQIQWKDFLHTNDLGICGMHVLEAAYRRYPDDSDMAAILARIKKTGEPHANPRSQKIAMRHGKTDNGIPFVTGMLRGSHELNQHTFPMLELASAAADPRGGDLTTAIRNCTGAGIDVAETWFRTAETGENTEKPSNLIGFIAGKPGIPRETRLAQALDATTWEASQMGAYVDPTIRKINGNARENLAHDQAGPAQWLPNHILAATVYGAGNGDQENLRRAITGAFGALWPSNELKTEKGDTFAVLIARKMATTAPWTAHGLRNTLLNGCTPGDLNQKNPEGVSALQILENAPSAVTENHTEEMENLIMAARAMRIGDGVKDAEINGKGREHGNAGAITGPNLTDQTPTRTHATRIS